MARFQSTVAMIIDHVKFNAGQTFADSVANKVGKDYVWAGMSSTSMHPGLVPLDGTATTMKNASRFATAQVPSIDGVNSIGGQ